MDKAEYAFSFLLNTKFFVFCEQLISFDQRLYTSSRVCRGLTYPDRKPFWLQRMRMSVWQEFLSKIPENCTQVGNLAFNAIEVMYVTAKRDTEMLRKFSVCAENSSKVCECLCL